MMEDNPYARSRTYEELKRDLDRAKVERDRAEIGRQRCEDREQLRRMTGESGGGGFGDFVVLVMALTFAIGVVIGFVRMLRGDFSAPKQTKIEQRSPDDVAEAMKAYDFKATLERITPIIGQEKCEGERIWVGYRNNSGRTFGYVGLAVTAYEPGHTKQLLEPGTNARFDNISRPGDVVGECRSFNFTHSAKERFKQRFGEESIPYDALTFKVQPSTFTFIEDESFEHYRRDNPEAKKPSECAAPPTRWQGKPTVAPEYLGGGHLKAGSIGLRLRIGPF
jgi:hypothetical protein